MSLSSQESSQDEGPNVRSTSTIIPLWETTEDGQSEGDPLTPLAQGWIPPYTGSETPKVSRDELTPGKEDQRQPLQTENSESDFRVTDKTNTYLAEATTELQNLSENAIERAAESEGINLAEVAADMQNLTEKASERAKVIKRLRRAVRREECTTTAESNSDVQVKSESDNQNGTSMKTQMLKNMQKYLALQAKEKEREERDKMRSPQEEEGKVSDIEVEEVVLSDLEDEVTNIVRHDVSEPEDNFYDEYYGITRDREGPISPPSPCYSKYREQDEPSPHRSQTTVPETPTTPSEPPVPPPGEPKKKPLPIKFPSTTPKKTHSPLTKKKYSPIKIPKKYVHEKLDNTTPLSSRGEGLSRKKLYKTPEPWLQGCAPRDNNPRFLSGQTPPGTNPNIHPSGWYQDNNEEGVNPSVRTEDEDNDEIGTTGTSEEEKTE